MTDIEQATEALIAAIDAARHRLPRGDGAHEAERHLLCGNAKRLIHAQSKRIKRRQVCRSSRRWRAPIKEQDVHLKEHDQCRVPGAGRGVTPG